MGNGQESARGIVAGPVARAAVDGGSPALGVKVARPRGPVRRAVFKRGLGGRSLVTTRGAPVVGPFISAVSLTHRGRGRHVCGGGRAVWAANRGDCGGQGVIVIRVNGPVIREGPVDDLAPPEIRGGGYGGGARAERDLDRRGQALALRVTAFAARAKLGLAGGDFSGVGPAHAGRFKRAHRGPVVTLAGHLAIMESETGPPILVKALIGDRSPVLHFDFRPAAPRLSDRGATADHRFKGFNLALAACPAGPVGAPSLSGVENRGFGRPIHLEIFLRDDLPSKGGFRGPHQRAVYAGEEDQKHFSALFIADGTRERHRRVNQGPVRFAIGVKG